MRYLNLPLLLLASAVLVACGSAGGMGGTTEPQVLPGIHVDAVNGSDATGTGAADRPFKSIKRGLQGAVAGDVVRVQPGTYDAANGEIFPIIPPMGVEIVGTERRLAFRRLWLSRVVGGGFWIGDPDGRLHATIVPNQGSRIASLAVMNPQPFVGGGAKPAAVVLAIPGATLDSMLLHGSDKGVRITGGVVTNTLITGTTFTDNGIGVFVDGALPGNRIETSRITENSAGVMMFTPGVDFGGGPDGSRGLNIFAGNGGHDFIHFTGLPDAVFAMNGFWDAASPTRATGLPPSIADADIWEANSGPVVTNGAQQFVPDEPFALPTLPVIAQ